MKRTKSMFATESHYKKWLRGRRWTMIRARKLAANPWCERCLENHRRTPASEVHHRVPVLSAPSRSAQEDLMFDEHNLVSLCSECHKAVHREMGKSTHKEADNRERLAIARFRKLIGL